MHAKQTTSRLYTTPQKSIQNSSPPTRTKYRTTLYLVELIKMTDKSKFQIYYSYERNPIFTFTYIVNPLASIQLLTSSQTILHNIKWLRIDITSQARTLSHSHQHENKKNGLQYNTQQKSIIFHVHNPKNKLIVTTRVKQP